MSADRRDSISEIIDAELFGWLEKTVATASSDDDFVDVYAGAVAGLSRFLWVHRKDGVPIETVVQKVAGDVRDFFNQANDYERGGTA